MLLARLLGWIRSHTTFQIFVLEILAVFIGITASLFVDSWRQRQDDYETLDHLLEEIHYNAIVRSSQIHIVYLLNNLAVQSAIDLLYGDTDSLTDEELLSRISLAGVEAGARGGNAGYIRLSNSSLAIPFSETMAQLDEIYSLLDYWEGLLNGELAEIRVGYEALLEKGGLILDYDTLPADALAAGARVEWNRFVEDLEAGGGNLFARENLANVRLALSDTEFRGLLKQLLQDRLTASQAYLGVMGYNDQVVSAIRSRLPDVTLPIREIGLLGSAAPLGWEESVPMRQDEDDPNVWSTTVVLTDGEIKFRADDNWSTNWGGPRSGMALVGQSSFTFRGDESKVFPTGVADFNGTNIPVKAGRYKVTFNTRTFEYVFESIRD